MVLNLDNSETRRTVESCYRTTSTLINPIIDWTDLDVWEFLKHNGCQSNPEYKTGCKRIGCIGCPMASYSERKKEFARYPEYRKLYIHAFDRMLNARKKAGKEDRWKTGEQVMRWWLGEDPFQITIEDYLKYLDEQSEIMEDL